MSLFSFWRRPPKMLGVILCYNDADMLADTIEHLLNNNHSIIAWDHGSNDETSEVLDGYKKDLLERQFIPRSFDFYQLYEAMSEHLIKNFIKHYDWISWPDQDEILEGYDRSKNYEQCINEVLDSPHAYVQFRNYNFWLTSEDNPKISSPVDRIRRYSLFPDCSPRIRAWKAKATNIRKFNHNPLEGSRFPQLFNLKHYPMRTVEQMERRIQKDRADLQRNGLNYHYDFMKNHVERLNISAEALHLDDGHSELNPQPLFNWRSIYGDDTNSPKKTAQSA